jgi:serine/threonine protein phosphatase 1
MWIRTPFLQSSGPYPESVAVIHGHTPQQAVGIDHPHRINLDTGAFQTGRLSALVIAGPRMRLVQASR